MARCHLRADCPTDNYRACPCLPAGGWCHGVRAATTDPHRITAWWRRQPDAIPGIAAGPSGLLLLDLDTHADRPPADPAAELLPGITLTPQQVPGGHDVVRTGRDTLLLLARLRGGHHLWYRAPALPDGSTLTQQLGRLGWQIDIKAGWSYGVAPTATTRTGPYRLLAGDPAHPGRMPDWLARESSASPPPPRSARRIRRPSSPVEWKRRAAAAPPPT